MNTISILGLGFIAVVLGIIYAINFLMKSNNKRKREAFKKELKEQEKQLMIEAKVIPFAEKNYDDSIVLRHLNKL